jgi:PAS domain S-box-containing protein
VLNEKEPFRKAIEVFISHKTNGIPIVNDEGVLDGVLSFARAFRLLSEDVDQDTPLKDIMARDLIVIGPDEDINELIERPVSVLPVVKDKKLVGMYSMPDTIRAYYNSTKALRSELDAIIKSLYNGIISIDSSGTIRVINPAATAALGIEPENTIGKNINDIFPEIDMTEVMRTGEAKINRKVNYGGKTFITTCTKMEVEDDEIGIVIINDLTESSGTHDEPAHAKAQRRKTDSPPSITEKYVFQDPISRRLLERIVEIAKVDSTVLITGESGVGKEVVAEILFEAGQRADKPFVKINCGAIPENLLESELFGYEAGAFTGAGQKGKRGILEAADCGTVFLDEIGALPLTLQVKLLRFIQEKEILRVGGDAPRKIDVRIIVATNVDLAEMVKDGSFRSDLYYRLNVVPVNMPPLRERKGDIQPLLYYFLNKYNAKYSRSKSFSASALNVLSNYDWPGNIREMENMVERFVVTSDNNIEGLSPQYAETFNGMSFNPESIRFTQNYKDIVNEYERALLRNALQKYGTTRKMSSALGLSQSTIVKKMMRLGIS